nr:hypothetical protein [Tanacetum cinerariifolium]
MQTRSSSRLVNNQSSNPTSSTNPNPKGHNHRRAKKRIENLNLDDLSPPVVTMADQRTMAQLLQAPTDGYEVVIVVPVFTADNFELKHGLLTLVQNKQFFGHDKEDPYAYVRYFNKITSTLKFLNVPNMSIKLMIFTFSLEGAARIWLEKEPSRSIFIWDDLVSKFINQFFPPSKTTNLRYEITNFQQRFDESFSEAWDRFKDLLQACPRHGFSELHQLNTFYNALTSKDQDSLNSASGGNFLDKMPRECLGIIESKSKVRYSRNKPVVAKVSTTASTFGVSPDVAELKDMVRALLLDKKGQTQSPAPVKSVEESCVTCGGTHSYRNCPTTDGNNYRDYIQEFVSQASAFNFNQRNTGYRPPMMSNQIRPPGFPPMPNNQNLQRNNQNRFIPNQNRGNNFNQGPVYQPSVVNSNTASTLSSSTLPSNTIANPRSDLKAITTRSGVSYDEPQIPPCLLLFLRWWKMNQRRNDERNREKANNRIKKFYQIFKDTSFKISFADALILMPKFASTLKALIGNKEKLSEMARTPLNEHCSVVLLKKQPKKLGEPGKFLIPCDFPGVAGCLALADLGASINLMPFFMWKKLSLPNFTPTCMTLEQSDRSISRPVGIAEDVYVKVGLFYFPADFVVVDFDADPRVPLILRRSFIKTRRALVDVFERSFGFFDTISSGNPTPYYDSIVSATSPTLTPFGNSDFLLEEVNAFLVVEDEPTSSEFHQFYVDPEGDILFLEAFLNDDPSLPPPNQRNYMPKVHKELKICEAYSEKSSINEPPVVELKDLPPHHEYAFLEGDNKLPVIITKDLSVEEKNALITILKSHKQAIAWKLFDIKECVDTFRTLKIKLTEAPILIALNWDMPFELMCDASDFAIGAVLGQCQDKYFRPIHYASKTMTEAESKYTTTEKEMLAVVAVDENRASWSDKLDDALWAFRTAYKTPIGCTPYKLVYGKACHLPVELKQKSYWALKHAIFDLKTAGDHRRELGQAQRPKTSAS